MADATVTRTVADRVRSLRRGRGWSARELAEACERAGMATLSRSAIAKIESGVRKSVTAAELAVLAEVLKVPPSALLATDAGLLEARGLQPLFATSDLRELLTLVAEGQWPDAIDLYRAVVGPHAPALRPDAEVVDVLAALQAFNAKPDGVPPVLVFVEHLARRAHPELAARLRRWSRQEAARLGVLDALSTYESASNVEPATEAYLVFQLQVDGVDASALRLQHWTNLDTTWNPSRGRDFVGDIDQVRDQVALLIEEAETGWASRARIIRLEFVLPRELVNLPVDQWPTEPGDVLTEPLGVRYQVAVRSLERMHTRKWHRAWRHRWSSLADTGAGLWLRTGADDPTHLRALASSLTRDLSRAVLVLDKEPDLDPNDALRVGMSHGVPVMLWSRTHLTGRALDATVDDMADTADLRETVRLIRGDAFSQRNPDTHVGSHITLLWDDPGRLLIPADQHHAPA